MDSNPIYKKRRCLSKQRRGHNLHYEKFADGSVKCIEDEIPFELPEGWVWERLGNVSTIARGGSPRPIEDYITDDANGINWIKIGDTEKDGKFIFHTKEKIKPAGLSKTRYVRSGDFLLTNSMSFGRPYILKTDGCIHDGWLVIGNIETVFYQDYLYYALSSGFMYTTLSLLAAGSTVKNLKSDTVRSVLFPIPPLGEQERMARRLEQLISFVDAINDEKSQLVDIINQTKTKILDLAIRGQPGPHDSIDEPASELLERIRREKEELIHQGKIKRDKKESVIFRGDDSSYYMQTENLVESLSDWNFDELPEGWQVCCMGEVCDYGACISVSTESIKNSAWILDLEDIEKDSGRILQRVKKADRDAVSTKHLFRKGQVLYSKLRPYLNKVVLADDDGYCTSEILPLEFSGCIKPAYARYYLMSPTFLRYANKCSYGVKMPRLGTHDGKKAVLPVPPFSEQQRIVIAIDAAFCYLDTILSELELDDR